MTAGAAIETERLRLRTYRPDDVGSLLAYYSRTDVCEFLLHEPWGASEAEEAIRKRVERTSLEGPGTALALVVESSGVIVGDVAAWTTDDTGLRAEVGWVFDPRHGGKGFATEAVAALVDVVFEERGLHRVVAQMDGRNDGSARLCERLGMQREAHLRQDMWCKGEWTDTVIYGLLASDPRPAVQRPSPG